MRVASGPLLASEVDVCFVTVKNTQLRDALRRVPANVLGGALVVPFLNGIDHVDYLRTMYPGPSVAPATMRVATVRVEPGVIRQTSPFAAVEIAAVEANRDRVVRVAAALESVGFDIRVREDEAAMLWDKLSFLAPLALLTTHERANAGVIRTRRREDALAVISEVVAVAAADGAAIDPQVVLDRLDAVPATMESSMQHDQDAGRRLELDAIGGALTRRATLAGLEIPVTARLVAELRARRVGEAG